MRLCGRYEGIDKVRSQEVTKKVGESLVPSLSKSPGLPT
jgi:tRNA G37 N-methylase TrmD